jgi:hypothetical protein
MADADSYVCIFCSSDIKRSEETVTVPNLGVLVHAACYLISAATPESLPRNDLSTLFAVTEVHGARTTPRILVVREELRLLNFLGARRG